MKAPDQTRRMAAALIALIAWGGLLIQWVALWGEFSPLTSLVVLSQYFTISTNLLVAIVFTGIALDRALFQEDWIVAGTMLAIVMVGVIYALLLRGTIPLVGLNVPADFITHTVVPILVPLYWLFLQSKQGLQWLDPLRWSVYPLVYLIVALIRGGHHREVPLPVSECREAGLAGYLDECGVDCVCVHGCGMGGDRFHPVDDSDDRE